MANIFQKISGQFSRQMPFYPTPTGQPIPSAQSNFTNNFGRNLQPVITTPLSNAQSNFTNNFGRTLPPPPPRTLSINTSPTPSPYVQPQPQNAPESPTPAKIDPYTAYSMLLMKQLKDAQAGTGSEDLLKRQRDLQRESIRLSEGQGVQTSLPGMKGGMSPEQYGSVRQAQVGALSSGIDSVAYELKKLENKRADIIEQLKFAQQAGDTAKESELAQSWKQKDEDYREKVFAETKRSNQASEATARIKANADAKAPETSPYRVELATQGRQAVKGLLNIATKNPGIFGRTAALPLPLATRSDDYRNYKAQLDYLKGNIIPAALSAMREASKTGGALGQVSDKEGAWLASSLGALEMSQDPETVKNQLKLIDESFQRWQDAVNQAGGTGGGGNNSQTIPKGTDGTSYGFPGYVSDGSQWVLK